MREIHWLDLIVSGGTVRDPILAPNQVNAADAYSETSLLYDVETDTVFTVPYDDWEVVTVKMALSETLDQYEPGEL